MWHTCLNPDLHESYVVDFRKVVLHSILATDMSMHDEYVRRVEEQAEAWKNDDIDINNEQVCDQERLTLCGAIIKCADIGNCVSQSDDIISITHHPWLQFLGSAI